MFNVFPQGVGEQVSRGAQSLGQAVMGLASRFTNPLGTLASDIGAAREAVSGTRLIGQRQSMQQGVTAPTPVLPSGTPMTGFDIYPTTPQSIPQNVAATAPQPAASLVSPSVPTFPTAGMGLMGNQNIRPLPTEQIYPTTRMAPTLADRGNVTTDITGMQGKVPIQTAYGTIYATPQQAQTQRVSEMGTLPAQSARLANIGEQARKMGMAKAGGRQIAQGYTETMRQFAESTIPEGARRYNPAPQGRFGQALVGNFPQSTEAREMRRQRTMPSTMVASSSPYIEEERSPFSNIYGFQRI
jgi:hypothetical protein